MTDKKQQIGAIEWCDLTVDAADDVKDFYCNVVGWQASPVSMGDYDDFTIIQPSSGEHEGATVAGICHARGTNSQIPAQWLMYVRVASVASSVKQCIAMGGEVLDGPRPMAGGDFCVIRDPAGAVLALVSD